MKTKYFLLAATAIATLAGCSSDNDGSKYYDGKIRLSATNDLLVSTRTIDQDIQATQFLDNEKVDVFMTDNEGSGTGYSNYTQPLVASATTTSGTTSLTFDAGSQFWPINEHSLNIWAVYPSGAAGTDVTATAVPFVVKADQSTADNYKASDLMTGIPTANNPLPAARAYDANVPLTFTHLLTKINITLGKTDATTEISMDQLKQAKVSLINTHRKTTFTVKGETKTVGGATDADAPDNGTQILMYDGTTTPNDALTYSCVMVPQTMAAATGFIKVELPNGDTYIYSIPTGGLNLQAQTVYNFDIKIHKASILLTATITAWNIGTSGTETDPGIAILQ